MLPTTVYQAALNTSPTGQYFLSPSVDPIFLEVNDTFLKIATLKREDIIGKKFFDVFAADPTDTKDTGVESVRKSFKRVIDTGKKDELPMQRYPIKTTLPDGSVIFEERYWRASNTPIFDDNGKLLCISHQTSEVTKNVYIENALRKSEARYHNLIESIDEGFCVIEVIFNDAGKPIDYVFHEVNPVFEAQTGLHNAKGQTMRGMVPEHEQHWFDLYGKVASTGVPVRCENEAKALGRIYDLYAYPIDEPENNMVGILFRDITQKKLQEESMRLSEEQLRLALDAADVGLWDVDIRNDYMFWPSRVKAMFGISPDKPVTLKDYYDGIHPDDREPTLASFANTTDPNLRTQYDAEYRTIGKEDQVIRWVAARGRGIFNDANECIRVIGTAIDITQRKANEEALRESEERLRELDRRKDEFLAMLAHELRNPLAPISAAAQLLQIAKLDEARVLRTSQIIERQVKHMTSLVDDLLDVSRVTRGLVELDITTLDISHVVADAIEQVTPLIRARKHHFEVQMSNEMPLVEGDKKRLVQVVSNVLNNAAKYTPEGGQLSLKTEVKNRQVHIQITDNGIGMTPELVSRAFDLFAQAERTSDRSSGGLGLGLALVKNMVEVHLGTVTCESDGLGKGSAFTICLPLLLVDEKRIESQPPDVSPKSMAPLRILVVDDNVDAACTLGMLLEAEGHEVMIENGSHRALERAKAEAPQVCLLDVGLPEMDGNELARNLRALPQTASSLLVAITGYGHNSDRDETLAAGFDHHLVKPVDTFELMSILASHDKG